MSEPFIGEIRMFGGNFAPRGWAGCNGQLLPIVQNTPLFSLLGTSYGGDGRTTFALPDLRGRVPLHPGRGPGLTDRRLGERSGSETKGPIQLVVEEAEHAHAIEPGGEAVAGGPVPSTEAAITKGVVLAGDLAPGELVTNLQPYLTLNFIIALTGLYPSRP
jgi:microcystin-dependent protein